MTARDDAVKTGGETGPHSAVRPDTGPAPEVNAGARGRAREDTPGSAQSGAHLAAQSEPDFGTLGEHLAEVRARFFEWVSPPDIWSKDRPGLAKGWAYACRGQWAREAGPSRRAGQTYQVLFAMPLKSVLAYIEWIIDRPSRLAAAIVLLVVLAQFPPISWLI